MNPALINWPAVLVAALSAFAIGGVWYNPKVFGTAWMVDSKLSQEEIQKSNMAKTFGFTALFALISSANLAAFLADPKTDLAWGATAGFLAGVWTFAAIATHSLFELKKLAPYFYKWLIQRFSTYIDGCNIGCLEIGPNQ
jgi:hypothetical protein